MEADRGLKFQSKEAQVLVLKGSHCVLSENDGIWASSLAASLPNAVRSFQSLIIKNSLS